MQNLKLSVPFYFLLVLTLFMSELPEAVVGQCTMAVIDGGCPDEDQCRLTCEPCYRGIGKVESFCDTHVELPFYLCTCVMSEGAPCHPLGSPPCPNNNNPPSPPSHLRRNSTSQPQSHSEGERKKVRGR